MKKRAWRGDDSPRLHSHCEDSPRPYHTCIDGKVVSLEMHPELAAPTQGQHCGCTGCDGWRARRVVAGTLVRPATKDPKYTTPGTTPGWPMGTWQRVGWSIRLEDIGAKLGIVVGFIDWDDKDNGGHLDCAVVLWNEVRGDRLLVTSRRWLAVA